MMVFVAVVVQMKGSYGLLSAIEWPLLTVQEKYFIIIIRPIIIKMAFIA